MECVNCGEKIPFYFTLLSSNSLCNIGVASTNLMKKPRDKRQVISTLILLTASVFHLHSNSKSQLMKIWRKCLTCWKNTLHFITSAAGKGILIRISDTKTNGVTTQIRNNKTRVWRGARSRVVIQANSCSEKVFCWVHTSTETCLKLSC